eukprot:5462134-Prymnesium_polylepis.1
MTSCARHGPGGISVARRFDDLTRRVLCKGKVKQAKVKLDKKPTRRCTIAFSSAGEKLGRSIKDVQKYHRPEHENTSIVAA